MNRAAFLPLLLITLTACAGRAPGPVAQATAPSPPLETPPPVDTYTIDTASLEGTVSGSEALAMVEHATQKPVLVHAGAIHALQCAAIDIKSNVKLTRSTFAERVFKELRPKGFVIEAGERGFQVSRPSDAPPDDCHRAEDEDPVKAEKEIRQLISETGPNERTITRHARELLMQHSATILMKQARIVPEPNAGLRLFGIRSTSIAALLGFENGDRLDAINGKDVSTPEKALEAYSQLRDARKLELTLNRRGQPMKLVIEQLD